MVVGSNELLQIGTGEGLGTAWATHVLMKELETECGKEEHARNDQGVRPEIRRQDSRMTAWWGQKILVSGREISHQKWFSGR